MGLPRTHDRGAPHEAEVALAVSRARAGDVRAFEDLVRRFQVPLMGYLTHLVQADAEDLAQEAFLKAHARLADLKTPAAFAGWLFAIARNLALGALARRPSPRMAPAPVTPELIARGLAAASAAETAEERERQATLAGALAALDQDNRDLLLLRYWAGLAPETIAGMVGHTPDRTRARLGYARTLLRQELLRRGGW